MVRNDLKATVNFVHCFSSQLLYARGVSLSKATLQKHY